MRVSKRKADSLDIKLSSIVHLIDRYSLLLDLVNNFQPLTAFMLIFIAIIIRFCDRVDFDRVDCGVSHLKDVV